MNEFRQSAHRIALELASALLTLMLALTALPAGANNATAHLSDASVIVSRNLLQNLPPGVQDWIRNETILLSRKTDTVRLLSPEQNAQNPLFAPEAGNVFKLYGFWIDSSELKAYESELPKNIKALVVRQHDGKTQFLFFVHPESYAYYAQRLDFSILDREEFLATSTASSRSLVVWKPGFEQDVFVAKVSLNATIGHVDRTIKGIETAMSIGIDRTLRGARDLPSQFSVFREVLGVIPTGMDRGGMILRALPTDMVNGSRTFIPFFSLYAKSPDGSNPLLIDMINRSGEDPVQFVENKIIIPFINEWFDSAMSGVLMEPHAQNVVMEIDETGMPTGRFRHRDFGGFNIDFKFRKENGLFVPEELPTFTGSIDADYYIAAHQKNLSSSLNHYFDAGFLHPLEQNLMEWQKANLIKGARIQEGELRRRALKQVSIKIKSVVDANQEAKLQKGPLKQVSDKIKVMFGTQPVNPSKSNAVSVTNYDMLPAEMNKARAANAELRRPDLCSDLFVRSR